MKKVLLFFVMILLVLVSARSLFCRGHKRHDFVHQNVVPYRHVAPYYGRKIKSKRFYRSYGRKIRSKRFYQIAKQEHTRLTGEIKRVLSRDIDGVSLQTIVRLLDCELEVVKGLLGGQGGIEIYRLLAKKDRLLESSTQTVSFVYGIIMNFATSNLLFDAKRGKIRPDATLTGAARKSYLKIVQRIVGQYRQQVGNKKDYAFHRVLGISSRMLSSDYHKREANYLILSMMPPLKIQ